MVMTLSKSTTDSGSVRLMILKRSTNTLSDTDDKEEKVKYCKCYQEVTEDVLETVAAQDKDSNDISNQPQGSYAYSKMSSNNSRYVAK